MLHIKILSSYSASYISSTNKNQYSQKDDATTRRVAAHTRHSPNAGLMLSHRPRPWPSIRPALDERFVFAGVGSRRCGVDSADSTISSPFARRKQSLLNDQYTASVNPADTRR